jgi:hypothetical protein
MRLRARARRLQRQAGNLWTDKRIRALSRVREYVRARPRLRYYCSRWPVAGLLDKSGRTCWGDLATWALGSDSLRDVLASNGGQRCRLEALELGSCYCGKFRTALVEAEARAHPGTGLQPGGIVVPVPPPDKRP